MRRRTTILCALVLGGCQTGADASDPDPSGRTAQELAAERAECLEEGGAFRPGGITQALMCFKPTVDAGKACMSNAECESLCLDTGKPGKGECAAQSPMFGCHAVYEEPGEVFEICID